MNRLRIIVGGFLGLLPAGGVAWDYVQYPVGLAALGHDVYYVEDTGLWPIYQADRGGQADCTVNVAHLATVMHAFGLDGRWAYRDEVSDCWFGLEQASVRELCRTADVFLNISCATPLRDEYLTIPVRALVDTDPMFTQIQYETQTAFTDGTSSMRLLVDSHTHHFTYGENIGSNDCRVPTCGIRWRHTRQPICLEHWPALTPTMAPSAFRTIMNWSAGMPLVYKDESWGQKNVEFNRLLDLPSMVPAIPLAVAVGQTAGDPFSVENARQHGWHVMNAGTCASTWSDYQRFIQNSVGEFSIAKETYVKARTGWFSGRSACYLASGRPVVTQDTGWSQHLPNGDGLLAFTDMRSATEALNQVVSAPSAHARAARAIADEYFGSDRILGEMLSQMGN